MRKAMKRCAGLGIEFADGVELYYAPNPLNDLFTFSVNVEVGTEENDKLKGFNAGCDDYITKPFSTRELVARIRAVMKRSTGKEPGDALTMGKLTLDPSSHRVLIDDHEIQIGPTEYRLLKFFMTHPDRVYSRGQLLDYVWGETTYIEERTVDVHIRRLRMALSEHGMDGLIQTVRGAGYRLSAPDQATM